MFIEINPADAAARNIRDGQWVLVQGPEMPRDKWVRVKALVTERVGRGVAWMPFHARRLVHAGGPAAEVSAGHRPDRVG